MHPGDASHITFVAKELNEVIDKKTRELIKSPSERTAGYIQGIQDALALMQQQKPDTR